MGNANNCIVTFIGKTCRNDDDTTSILIPTDFANEINIGNSKVLISLFENDCNEKFLLVSKLYREIVIN